LAWSKSGKYALQSVYLEEPLRKNGVQYTIEKRGEVFGIDCPGRFRRAGCIARDVMYAALNDIVLIQKGALSQVHLSALLRVNDNVVYDLDDAMYALPPWHDGDAEARRERMNRMLRHVPYAIVGSKEIREYASRFCDEIFVAPTALPRERYERYSGNEPTDQNSFNVGWIGNGENLWYLEQIEKELARFLSERNEARLHIVTSSDPPRKPLADRVGDDVHYIEWSEDKELDYLNQFDAGIRPLTDDEWTRSKGGFTSVIQCMAAKTPVVVSPVGSLEEIVVHGETGYHAVKSSDWMKYLNQIADSKGRQGSMGRAAFERMGETKFWTTQRAEELAEFYKSII